MSIVKNIPPAALKNTAQLYVSTKAAKDKTPNGKWFVLNNYANKSEFLEAATDYAINELNDSNPKLVFSGIQAEFETLGLYDDDTYEPTDDFWTIFTLSEEHLAILSNYASFYGNLGDGVKDVLAAALDDHIGCFETDKDFVTHKLREAGATDEVLMMLGDACKWEVLASSLNYGFMHNRHYYHL